MIPCRNLEGKQDLIDGRKLKKEEYLLRAKKYILENLTDEDLACIEVEHWPNIKRLHEERISERKAKHKDLDEI